MSPDPRFTSPGEAMEALRTKMRAAPRAERLYKCHRCLDSGWEELKQDGRGLLKRCSNGCETSGKKGTKKKPEAKGGTFS